MPVRTAGARAVRFGRNWLGSTALRRPSPRPPGMRSRRAEPSRGQTCPSTTFSTRSSAVIAWWASVVLEKSAYKTRSGLSRLFSLGMSSGSSTSARGWRTSVRHPRNPPPSYRPVHRWRRLGSSLKFRGPRGRGASRPFPETRRVESRFTALRARPDPAPASARSPPSRRGLDPFQSVFPTLSLRSPGAVPGKELRRDGGTRVLCPAAPCSEHYRHARRPGRAPRTSALSSPVPSILGTLSTP